MPTFEEVSNDDLTFRTTEAEKHFDAVQEAQALRRLLDEANPVVHGACDALSHGAKLDAASTAFAPWQDQPDAVLGNKLREIIVDRLDALHLKPSGIEDRLAQGVSAACFGLFTLVQHLQGEKRHHE